MGLLRTAIKAGIAKKVIDEARKPQNQQLVKQLVTSIAAGVSSRRASGGGRPRP